MAQYFTTEIVIGVMVLIGIVVQTFFVRKVSFEINSRMSELLAVTRREARAEGVKETRDTAREASAQTVSEQKAGRVFGQEPGKILDKVGVAEVIAEGVEEIKTEIVKGNL